MSDYIFEKCCSGRYICVLFNAWNINHASVAPKLKCFAVGCGEIVDLPHCVFLKLRANAVTIWS